MHLVTRSIRLYIEPYAELRFGPRSCGPQLPKTSGLACGNQLNGRVQVRPTHSEFRNSNHPRHQRYPRYFLADSCFSVLSWLDFPLSPRALCNYPLVFRIAHDQKLVLTARIPGGECCCLDFSVFHFFVNSPPYCLSPLAWLPQIPNAGSSPTSGTQFAQLSTSAHRLPFRHSRSAPADNPAVTLIENLVTAHLPQTAGTEAGQRSSACPNWQVGVPGCQEAGNLTLFGGPKNFASRFHACTCEICPARTVFQLAH
jgi:hypothetical protein